MSDYLRHPVHGPLPALLLLLTVSTGVVDAVSLLRLGHVFVANMTGNIVFIGLAISGSPGFSLAGSVTALLAFAAGAGLGGLAIRHRAADRARLLRDAATGEVLLIVGAALVWQLWGGGSWLAVVTLTAVALGLQNAAVRHLAVPDLTTTVLTMTITGIAADLRSGNGRTALRRGLAVATMLAGAALGAVVVLHTGVVAALLVSVGLCVVGAAGAAHAAATGSVQPAH